MIMSFEQMELLRELQNASRMYKKIKAARMAKDAAERKRSAPGTRMKMRANEHPNDAEMVALARVQHLAIRAKVSGVSNRQIGMIGLETTAPKTVESVIKKGTWS